MAHKATRGRRRLAVLIVVAAVAPVVVHAQDWQTVAMSRQYQGESQFTATVQFLAGALRVRGGNPASLYKAQMRFDAERFNPINRFRVSPAALRVGLEAEDLRGHFNHDAESPQYMDLELSPAVPTDLRLKFGMARADIELGGLSISSATFETGASETSIRFSEANRTSCSHLDVAAGAAHVELTELGNANCSRIEVKGGAGDITLDFTGEWASDLTIHVDVGLGLGKLNLRVPERLGVRVKLDRLLVGFNQSGLTKRGSYWYSSNYETATSRLMIDIDAALGDVDLVWVP